MNTGYQPLCFTSKVLLLPGGSGLSQALSSQAGSTFTYSTHHPRAHPHESPRLARCRCGCGCSGRDDIADGLDHPVTLGQLALDGGPLSPTELRSQFSSQ